MLHIYIATYNRLNNLQICSQCIIKSSTYKTVLLVMYIRSYKLGNITLCILHGYSSMSHMQCYFACHCLTMVTLPTSSDFVQLQLCTYVVLITHMWFIHLLKLTKLIFIFMIAITQNLLQMQSDNIYFLTTRAYSRPYQNQHAMHTNLLPFLHTLVCSPSAYVFSKNNLVQSGFL